MTRNALRASAGLFLLMNFLLAAASLDAQVAAGGLSGTVSDSSGHPLAGAKILLKNVGTGQSVDTESDSSGQYHFSDLAAGDYEISASSDSLINSAKVSVTPGATQTLNLSLVQGSPAVQGNPAAPEALPNAPSSTPSSSKTEPSLEDLGFSKSEQQANLQEQALLDKRTRMLRIHQRMGLITTIPLIATVVTSLNAGGKSEGTASRDLHVALGAVTGDLYGITAWYAIRAPRIKGAPPKRGPIRFHEAMAWIHGPGMILTPILGAIAFSQKNNGEKVHGIAQAHGPVAIVTAGAFGAALLSVSVKF